MVQDLSHIKVTPPQNQPSRGLGSPMASPSDPSKMAAFFKLRPAVKTGEEAVNHEGPVQHDESGDGPDGG